MNLFYFIKILAIFVKQFIFNHSLILFHTKWILVMKFKIMNKLYRNINKRIYYLAKKINYIWTKQYNYPIKYNKKNE